MVLLRSPFKTYQSLGMIHESPAHVIWWLGPCAREQIDMSSSRILLCFFHMCWMFMRVNEKWKCVECSSLFFLHWCPFPARNGTVALKKILECMCKCHLSPNHFSPHVGWLRRCLHGYFCWSYLNDLWRNTPKWWNMAVCHRGMVINPFLDSNDWTDDPTLRMYDVWPWHKNISSYVYLYIYIYTHTLTHTSICIYIHI